MTPQQELDQVAYGNEWVLKAIKAALKTTDVVIPFEKAPPPNSTIAVRLCYARKRRDFLQGVAECLRQPEADVDLWVANEYTIYCDAVDEC